jgi:hypothetical protein
MSDRTAASTPVAQLLREGHKKSHPECRWDGPHYVPPSLRAAYSTFPTNINSEENQP